MAAAEAAAAAAAPPAVPQEQIQLKNWQTDQVVGYWKKVGMTRLAPKLWSDWKPCYQAPDGTEKEVPNHEHTEGYFNLRLPGGGKDNKPLFHRQLWQDLHGRKANSKEVVHHVNHQKGDNRAANLQLLPKSEHNRHHARGLRRPAAWNQRMRPPRRNQGRGRGLVRR